ncbi:hypothetical protein [Nocardia pseudobrasiliensis]|uniref:Uncharacterized protein n=1 Tax=Nocardia pseudobrasiliensis TaxID=45979 RepID=A0A370I4M0_9NOCA|nr:hypothetical protein [Nocardia pseudobrasiliensis]RDI65693.1 hypothetical protein DFR76_1055 [Nocardia pseudobrasiliensis]
MAVQIRASALRRIDSGSAWTAAKPPGVDDVHPRQHRVVAEEFGEDRRMVQQPGQLCVASAPERGDEPVDERIVHDAGECAAQRETGGLRRAG